jgi:hypothetical protein
MLYLLTAWLDEWLIRHGWRTPPVVEHFPLGWCASEHRADCGICGCCLYQCWDIED